MPLSELIVDRAVLADVVMAKARVQCAGGRITAIAPTTAAPTLRGTLLPGFVDLQVNGAGGCGVEELTTAALQTVARAVFAGGAVAFLPTLITAPWPQLLAQVGAVAKWCEAFEPDAESAAPVGLHVEGPFLTSAGVHDQEQFADPTRDRIDALLAAGRGRIRLVTLSSARAGAAAAVAQLRQAGVTVSIGHVAETTGFDACVQAGAQLVTHLFNAMGPMHHREHGVAMQALDSETLSCPLILDGIHVHPVMVRNCYRILGPDRMVLVTDAVAAAGMPDGDYVLAGEHIRLRGNTVTDTFGRLAGSALTMANAARAFLDWVPAAGVWTLARAAATNPAALVAAEGYGSIAVGQRAAFTLLGDDGSVRALRV